MDETISGIRVVYRDADILVCVKEPGMLTQPDLTGQPDLLTILTQHYEHVYPIHRLDRNVGGLLVFALSKAAASKLSLAVREHEGFTKEYLAVVEGICEGNGEMVDYLYHNKRLHKSTVVTSGHAEAKEARLCYRGIEKMVLEKEICSLIQVRLCTGRFHQIRAQFSSRGMPLIGDGKYGSVRKCPIGLWACRLAFAHPRTQEQLAFFAFPRVADFPWSLFGSVLQDSSLYEKPTF